METDNWWMISEITVLPGVRHVLVTTSDGLVKIRSDQLPQEEAERLGAACAGLHSLGRGIGQNFGDGTRDVHQVMVGYDGGYLFVRRAGDGSNLAVVTGPAIDAALIGQQMSAQVREIGRSLATPPRQAATGTTA